MAGCSVKNLWDVSAQEQADFLNSFDTVLSDIDGVLWIVGESTIEGAPEGIKALRNIKKQIFFVTNNTTVPLAATLERLSVFEPTEDHVIRPDLALVSYLKKIKFDKEIYVVGTEVLRDTLTKGGFQVHYDPGQRIEETVEGVAKGIYPSNSNIGAVIVDIDLNTTFSKLQKCVEYIKKNNALFLAGCGDPLLPFKQTRLIGPKYFIEAIEKLSDQKATILSKPHKEFHEAVEEKLGNLIPEQVLFIGDSIPTDMAYAAKFGFKKLIPLTGATTINDLNDWKYDESSKPDYYVDNLGDLMHIIENLKLKCLL